MPIVNTVKRAAKTVAAFMRGVVLGAYYATQQFTFSNTQQTTVAYGILPNPDEALLAHGRGEGVALYNRVLRQVPHIAGCLETRIAAVMSLPRGWYAQDESDAEQVAAAKVLNAAWDSIAYRDVALARWLRGIFTGFAVLETVWGQIDGGLADGLICPVSIIDRPTSWWGFNANDQLVLQKANGDEEIVPEEKVMVFRFGSLNTKYGLGEGSEIYLHAWAIDTIIKFGLEGLEKFGYPIALVMYPRSWDDETRDSYKAGIRTTWKNFIFTPFEGNEPKVEFPNASMVNAGTIGDSQLNWIKKFEDAVSKRLLGWASSDNSTTGSYGKEKVGEARIFDKTGVDAAALDAAINYGWGRPVMLMNYPNLPPSRWPKHRSDNKPTEDLKALAEIVDKAVAWGFKVSKAWVAKTFQIAAASDESDEMKKAETPQDAPQQPGQGNARLRLLAPAGDAPDTQPAANFMEVPTDDGKVIRLGAKVMTSNRGLVDLDAINFDDDVLVLKAEQVVFDGAPTAE